MQCRTAHRCLSNCNCKREKEKPRILTRYSCTRNQGCMWCAWRFRQWWRGSAIIHTQEAALRQHTRSKWRECLERAPFGMLTIDLVMFWHETLFEVEKLFKYYKMYVRMGCSLGWCGLPIKSRFLDLGPTILPLSFLFHPPNPAFPIITLFYCSQ